MGGHGGEERTAGGVGKPPRRWPGDRRKTGHRAWTRVAADPAWRLRTAVGHAWHRRLDQLPPARESAVVSFPPFSHFAADIDAGDDASARAQPDATARHPRARRKVDPRSR